jgi:hypothetical protein
VGAPDLRWLNERKEVTGMSHFYGSMRGSAAHEATRCGTRKSSIASHTRGWESGVEVFGWYNEATGMDVFEVYATEGSKWGSVRVPIAVVTADYVKHFTRHPGHGAREWR